MTVPAIATYYDALLAAVDAAVPEAVYDAQVKGPAPYLVLYPGGQLLDGTLANPHDDMAADLQVKSVGRTRSEAQRLAQKARLVLLAPVVVAGRSWAGGELEVSRPVERDDDVSPPLFYVDDIFRLDSTPA